MNSCSTICRGNDPFRCTSRRMESVPAENLRVTYFHGNPTPREETHDGSGLRAANQPVSSRNFLFLRVSTGARVYLNRSGHEHSSHSPSIRIPARWCKPMSTFLFLRGEASACHILLDLLMRPSIVDPEASIRCSGSTFYYRQFPFD